MCNLLHYNYYQMPEPDDYVQLDGVQVTFNPGEFTKTVTLQIVDDGIAEGDEHFNATLSPTDSRVTVSEPVAEIWITEDGTHFMSNHVKHFSFSLHSYSDNIILN